VRERERERPVEKGKLRKGSPESKARKWARLPTNSS
jgi:hypothetical protein